MSLKDPNDLAEIATTNVSLSKRVNVEKTC